jgi:hypothetical protein
LNGKHKCEDEFGCLTLSERHKLALFEKMLGTTCKEVRVGWRKLRNEELHNDYEELYLLGYNSMYTLKMEAKCSSEMLG